MARGKLRIYLGAAPGVGKTYDMLNEGWRRAHRGTDVVVGYVETHGRANTAAQVRDLEIVPRKKLVYRGQTFEEMDVDAVLARHPQVALVDELAHTNVPGSRNSKRWQDVNELLDAGIDVISTVNIQHLESLNDVVERITGITQREKIPDAVVRAADQVEMVDMTPEAIRRRMAHGNIYPAERVDTALANYFRAGNLGALRELALLWVADQVDDALQDYRERHGIAGPWETRERVVVTLTGAPGNEDLIRRAARMARRTHGELIGLHVCSDEGLSTPSSEGLERNRTLLEELGGSYREVVGTDVAVALVQAAKRENATQLVLGASRRSRWTELTNGSVINAVIRAAGGAMDIHIISTSSPEASALPHHQARRVRRLRLAPISRRRQVVGLVLALVGLPLMTFALANLRAHLDFSNVLMCFLLAVVGIAAVGGVVPGTLAAVVGFLLMNWYFAAPVHTLTIADQRDLLALVTFFVVTAVVSWLVDLSARRSIDANRARVEAKALAEVAGSLLREADPLPDLLANLVTTFRLDGAAVLTRQDGACKTEAAAGAAPPHDVAGATVVLPLSGPTDLVLAGRHLVAEDREVLDAFAAQLAVAMESRRLQSEAAEAAALAKTNELRSALLTAVSHDLRTPLASIKAASSSLLADDVAWEPAATRALLETIDSEADRLNALLSNLLDMSRVQVGALSVSDKEVGLEEVVERAIAGLPSSGRNIVVDVPETLPQVSIDPALLERAVANLVDNAVRFSPFAGTVRVEAGAVGTHVDLRVIDRGRGIPPAERERVFQPFQRLDDRSQGPGVGLGLAVARGFVEAMGGELAVEDTPGGGCTMVVSLPVAEAPATAEVPPAPVTSSEDASVMVDGDSRLGNQDGAEAPTLRYSR